MSLPLGLLMSTATSTPSANGPATAEQGALDFGAIMEGALDILATASPAPGAGAELVFSVVDGPSMDVAPSPVVAPSMDFAPSTVAEATIPGTESVLGATDPAETVVVPFQASAPVPSTPNAVQPNALTVLQPNVPAPTVRAPSTPASSTPASSTPASSTPAPILKSAPATLHPVAVVPADPMAQPPVPPAPVQAAPSTPVAPVPSVPLATQVARPLFSLVGVRPGEHVLTISVTPDNLGPVTVRAHVTAEGIRVELFAPTDLARDALRAILPDLRRDLAGSGMNAHLDLSSQNQATDPHAPRHERTQPDVRNVTDDHTDDHTDAPNPEQTSPTAVFGTSSTIDVMA